MKLFKWLKGRQKDAEYLKLCLWNFKIFKFGFDCYILKYKQGTNIPWHKDLVKNGNHYRLNINIKGTSFLVIDKNNYQLVHLYSFPFSDFSIFRPDLYKHRVTVVTNSIKLSFGFVKFK